MNQVRIQASRALYEPRKGFVLFATIMMFAGIVLLARFGYYYLIIGQIGGRHIQSLIFAIIVMMVAVLLFAIALLSDLTMYNHRLLRDTRDRVLEMERSLDMLEQTSAPSERIGAAGYSSGNHAR